MSDVFVFSGSLDSISVCEYNTWSDQFSSEGVRPDSTLRGKGFWFS